MNKTKKINLDFQKAIEKLNEIVPQFGFRVLYTHDVKKTLSEKGFEIENYSIIEVCNAKFANEVLKHDKEFGSMMPCKILLYTENKEQFISLPLPTKIAENFGMQEIKGIAEEVENSLLKIFNEIN